MKRIIFFDGVCPVCNGFVDFAMKRDPQHQFLFSSLQSETAHQILSAHDLGLDSVIYREDGKTYYKSKAVLRIFFAMGGAWTLLSLLLSVIPMIARDYFYDLFAKNRYRLFGKFESCRLPKYEEKAYFLE